MTTTEAALRASRGTVLPDELAARTGRSASDTSADLTLLMIQGQAQEVGGRWKWTGAAAGIKGGTVRRRGEPRPPAAKAGAASRPRAHIYPIQVVTTRWKDSRTGRFTRSPKEATPLRLKIGRASQTDGMIITRIHKTDEATGLRVPVRYKVQYLEARAAHGRGELGLKELRALETDIADGLLSEEGQAILAKVDALKMGAAHRSDKATRAAATRKTTVATKKHRAASAIQTDHLKAQNDLKEAKRKMGAAKTAHTRHTYQTQVRNLNLKLGRLAKEAKAAGVRL